MRKTAATLLFSVVVLVVLGLIMLASVSTVRAQALSGDPYLFLRRQIFWLALAAPLAVLVAHFDYHWLQRRWVMGLLLLVTIAGLTAVFIPGLGVRLYGSARWIRIGGLRMQPSEFAKLAVIMLSAAWLDRIGWRVRRFREGFLIPICLLGLIAGLLFLEPDYGAMALVGALAFAIMLAAGVRLRYLMGAAVLGMLLFALLVLHDPVRRGRVLAFMDADGHAAISHQLVQSKAALIRGGLLGVGLGNSIQKHLYLPEAHTDFIFAILGEELGLIGTLSVVLLFTLLFFCGIQISARAPDTFGKLLAFGMTLLLGLQAMVNIGVVTGLLPTTGLALPFISYGGSSLLVSMVAVGLLINILKHVEMANQHKHTRPIRNAVRRF